MSTGNKVVLDLETVVDGRTWYLYSFNYKTVEGNFSGYLHATSAEHASYMLEEMRETAVLDGQIIETGKF